MMDTAPKSLHDPGHTGAPSESQASVSTAALSVRQARDLFFDELEYEGGGYEEKVFRIKFGRWSLPLPNLSSRVQAVRFHDLHHLATGFGTDWVGEAEVGAWELATGCRGYWAAWLLNFSAFAVGLVLAPRRVFRAFVLGRHSRNLYGESWHESLLDQSLEELKDHLGLRRGSPRATPGDLVLFALWGVAALLQGALAATLVVGAGYLAWAALRASR